jgi:hypothetical protein
MLPGCIAKVAWSCRSSIECGMIRHAALLLLLAISEPALAAVEDGQLAA